MRSEIGKIVTSLIFGLAAVAASVQAQENYTEWANSRSLVINTSSSAANVAGNVTQYPLLVRLTPANFTALGTAGTKASLRFARGATKLKYHVQDWDSAGAAGANVWVLVDTVFGNNATQSIQMHWGKANAPDSSRAASVFSAANGFVGVWHLGNPVGGNAQTGARPNVAGAANHARPLGLPSGWTTVPGVIGLADTLPGLGTTNISGSTGFALDTLPVGTFTTGEISISAWVSSGHFEGAAVVRSVVTLSQNVGACCTVAGNSLLFGLGTGQGPARLGSQTRNGENHQWATTEDYSWSENVWMHIALSIQNGTVGAARTMDSLYKNGVYLPHTTLAGSKQNMLDVARNFNRIGQNVYTGTGDSTFRGKLDEVRISNVRRNSHWTRLDYATQRVGANVVSFGEPGAPTGVTAVAGNASATVTWVAPASSGASAITGYTVTSTPGNRTCTATTLSCTVDSLTNGVAHTFRVTATNGSGVGAPSAPSTAVTPTAPIGVASGFAEGRAFGFADAHTFRLSPAAMAATDKVVLTLTDMHGRVVWNRVAHPARDGVTEITWGASGAAGVPAGIYLARASVTTGNKVTRVARKSVVLP